MKAYKLVLCTFYFAILLTVPGCSSQSQTSADGFVSDAVCDELLTTEVQFGTGTVTITTRAGSVHTIDVEVASSATQRQRGLMCRSELADGKGMYFILQSDTVNPFWMKNTYIPLDIAYIDSAGVIADIREMRPCTASFNADGSLAEDWPEAPSQCVSDELFYNGGYYPAGYTPSTPYRTALEVPKGYFMQNGITVGDTVEFTQ